MKPRSCSSSSSISISRALLVLLLCCFCISVARSRTTDSCASSSSGLAAVSRLIPFDTSNLTCLDAWPSQGFIVRYGKSGQDTWSFVLSAPDAGGYVAVGFSANGAMVGSSAVAGWTTSGGVGVAKQYRLGGTSPGSCPPDQGSLALVPGTTLLAARASRLYLAFQFAAAARPAPYLIYAVGPSGAQLSNNYLVRHRSYASAAVDYATGVASARLRAGRRVRARHGRNRRRVQAERRRPRRRPPPGARRRPARLRLPPGAGVPGAAGEGVQAEAVLELVPPLRRPRRRGLRRRQRLRRAVRLARGRSRRRVLRRDPRGLGPRLGCPRGQALESCCCCCCLSQRTDPSGFIWSVHDTAASGV